MINKMDKNEPIDTKDLIEKAESCADKEAYKMLDKTRSYRIGVGTKVDSPTSPSFFIEVIIKLSPENGKVNLQRLRRMLISLEALQKEGYILSYQDDNTVCCEKTILIYEILQQLNVAKSIISDGR